LSATTDNLTFPAETREWLWPLALAVTIFVASGRSQVAAPDVPNVDKFAHFFVYGLLGTLFARVPSVATWSPLGVYAGVVLASLYGIGDEFHQSFTPGRSVELLDWLMDTSGAALAVFIYARWHGYRRFLERPAAPRSRVEIAGSSAPDSVS
jgi:VanZ family protein